MSRNYNDPGNVAGDGAKPSNIGSQFRTDHYAKRALIEMRKEQHFGQLANVASMPKNMGKTMKKYHYLPLLDDANLNDQGIDANGDAISPGSGNLYGSSKDVGTISGKMPILSETGGRVNRVGFKRKEIEGTIAKFGFFDEYTQESLDFDTDADLQTHINREMLNGANEITEDLLQIDLLNAAGVEKFGGAAQDDSEVDATSEVTYDDLLRLSIDLDNNRTPKQTKIITGTRLVDTKTLPGGRVMYIGSELQVLVEGMVDLHGNPAFISVEKYAAGGTVLNGEIGTVGKFRIVVVPEMMKWEGAGAALGGNETHFSDDTNFDIFPMLVVGDSSFSTIGFQTDGKTVKFKIKHAAPGSTESYAQDPYGETGFMSIKWYYGFMLERGERIALLKTSAPM